LKGCILYFYQPTSSPDLISILPTTHRLVVYWHALNVCLLTVPHTHTVWYSKVGDSILPFLPVLQAYLHVVLSTQPSWLSPICFATLISRQRSSSHCLGSVNIVTSLHFAFIRSQRFLQITNGTNEILELTPKIGRLGQRT
jgi:hypothetical protein